MTGLSFDPVGGWWLIAAIALALAPLIAIGPPRRQRQSIRRRLALSSLRGLTLILLLLFLVRPALETRTKRTLPGTLLVLSDVSRSMQVADAASNISRFTAMKKALNASAGEFAKLAEAWDVHGYGFGEDLQPLKFADGKFALPAEPVGSQTAIGAAIDDTLAREAQQRLVAVVLLSDGAQRAFAPRDVPPQTAVRRLAADGIPLYTVAFGQPSLGEQSDLRMSDLLTNDVVFADTPTTIEGVVSAAGYANQEVKVQLLWENADGDMEPVDARTITVAPGKRRFPIRLTHTPDAPGEYKVTLQVESPAGELVTTNNSQSTFVTVLKGGVNILYLAGAARIGGRPGIEPRFIRSALSAHADLNVKYEEIDYQPPELDQQRQIREAKYDVFLLGDVDVTGLSQSTWEEIARSVERGAGLAMLGGFHSFGPGGYATSVMADVLPVKMTRAERQPFGEPPSDDLHIPGPIRLMPRDAGGEPHPIFRIKAGPANEALWRELPPLDGANKFSMTRLQSTATVVAEADNASRSPLMVLGAYGSGRTAAFAGDSTWHWQLEGFGEVHRRFWRQFILWLAKKDETAGQLVWLRLDQRRYQQGARVDFTLGAENASGDPLADAQFDVQIEKPDGSVASVRSTPRGEAATASFSETAEPGDYRILVAARADGKTVGTAEARFSVSDQDVELDQPAAEPLLLASLASLTADAGGAALAPEELPDLLDRLQAKTEDFEEEIVETITLWDGWPPLLAFVGLLSTEWYLRKRWGLV